MNNSWRMFGVALGLSALLLGCPGPLINGNQSPQAEKDAGTQVQIPTDAGLPFDAALYCSKTSSVEIEPNNTPATATALDFYLSNSTGGESFSGCLPPGDEDFYRFVTTGDRPGYIWVNVELLDGAGTVIVVMTDNKNGDTGTSLTGFIINSTKKSDSFYFAALPGQIYTLHISASGDLPAIYRLSEGGFGQDDNNEPNNSISEARLVSLTSPVYGVAGCYYLGDSLTASFKDCSPDHDWFALDLNAGPLVITADQKPDASNSFSWLNVSLLHTQPEGNIASLNFSASGKSQTVQVPAAGRYYLDVYTSGAVVQPAGHLPVDPLNEEKYKLSFQQ